MKARTLLLIVAGALLVIEAACGAEHVRIGKPFKQIPQWAHVELVNFEKAETHLQEFLKRFTGPEGNTLGGENASHGAIDDRMEGLFRWDRFLVLGGSDDLRKKFINVWKWCWRYGIERRVFYKGFYRGSYDAEHGCELLPMLWACIELAPDDEELIRTNRRLADMLCSPVYFHPELHFLRYSAMNAMLTGETAPRVMRRSRGDNALNTMYTTAGWLAYLTTGKEKYRKWVLNYCQAWNKAAAMNGGVLPFGVDTATGSVKLGPDGNGQWWKANAGFGYGGQYGMITSSGGFQKLFVAAAYLDRGKPEYASGLVSTLKVLAKNAGKTGRFPGGYSPAKGGWHYKVSTGHVPLLIQRAYAVTWGEDLKGLKSTYSAGGRGGSLAKWFDFVYNGKHDMAWVEGVLGGGIKGKRLRKGIVKTATGRQPRGGDSQKDCSPLPARYNFDLIDGGLWGAGYNGRIGGPTTSDVGYFDESGRRCLPGGVAAFVGGADKGSTTVYLCNSRAQPVRMTITGGYYGQNRIDGLKCGAVGKPVADRKVRVELAAKSEAILKLKVSRCVYVPSLKPQSDLAREWK